MFMLRRSSNDRTPVIPGVDAPGMGAPIPEMPGVDIPGAPIPGMPGEVETSGPAEKYLDSSSYDVLDIICIKR